jgi:hypothetical protein
VLLEEGHGPHSSKLRRLGIVAGSLGIVIESVIGAFIGMKRIFDSRRLQGLFIIGQKRSQLSVEFGIGIVEQRWRLYLADLSSAGGVPIVDDIGIERVIALNRAGFVGGSLV